MIKNFIHFQAEGFGELFDTIEEEDIFFEKLLNDEDIIKYEDCFFFTQEAFNKYPEFNRMDAYEILKFKTFIEWKYDEPSDYKISNGLYADTRLIKFLAVSLADNEELHREFIKDPEAAMEKLEKEVKSQAVKSKMVYEGIEI